MNEWNSEQTKVINYKDGACLVSAGAGAGKTSTLVERISNLCTTYHIPQEDIMVTTFTNESAKDLSKKLSAKWISNIRVGTFHSICKRILMQEGISTDKRLALYEIENEFRRKGLCEKPQMNDIMSFISYQKNYGVGVNDTFKYKDSEYTENELRDFYKAYEDLKDRKGATDFDDWLLLTIDVLTNSFNKNKYQCKYLLVDEHQDSNNIQMQLIQLLCPSRNVMVVGDINQSLYGFRGSNPELFNKFLEYYPEAEVIYLYINYRSCNNIVNQANNFIGKYDASNQFHKDSVANNKKDGLIQLISSTSDEQEAEKILDYVQKWLAEGVKPNEMAILYRNNAHSFYIEQELKKAKIDYSINNDNGSFFNRADIVALMSMLRLIKDTSDDVAMENLFSYRSYPFTFLPKSVFDRIRDLSTNKNISVFDACELVNTDKSYQKSNLMIFTELIKNLIIQYNQNQPLYLLVNNIIKGIRIEDTIRDKYDGEKLTERLASIESFKKFVSNNTLDGFLKFVYDSKPKKKTDDTAVQLTTVHSSKGLEWSNVIISGIEDGKYPSELANSLEEEARIHYVAITRPKEVLILSQIGGDNRFVTDYFSDNRNY